MSILVSSLLVTSVFAQSAPAPTAAPATPAVTKKADVKHNKSEKADTKQATKEVKAK